MRSLAVLALAVLAVAAAACGSGNSAGTYEGAAASAASQYFTQESAGGRLPEGRDVSPVGTREIKTLTVNKDQKAQSTEARVCVEFAYTPAGSAQRRRVYIATLAKGAWTVEAVKPDGTCGDVE